MTWTETANRCVEIEQEVQEATIETTGDVGEAGPLSMLSACLSTLAAGDVETAQEMFLNLAKWLRDEEIELLR